MKDNRIIVGTVSAEDKAAPNEIAEHWKESWIEAGYSFKWAGTFDQEYQYGISKGDKCHIERTGEDQLRVARSEIEK